MLRPSSDIDSVGSWLNKKRYRKVFFLEPVGVHETTAVRMESRALAHQLSMAIQEEYRRFGYEPIVVPAVSTAERTHIIVQHLDRSKA